MSEFPDLIRSIVEGCTDKMNTAIPATFIEFDPKTCKAKVQPSIKIPFGDGFDTLPVINAVPVGFPSGGGFDIRFVPKRGDPCLLVFSMHDVDKWLTTGDVLSIGDDRKFNYSDAFAIPGFVPFPKVKQIPTDEGSASISFNDTLIELTKDGGVKIKTGKSTIEMETGGKVSINGSNLTVDS